MLDDQDYLVLRSDISKREFNDLASNMPAGADDGKMSMSEATTFQGYLFAALTVGWSLDGDPTIEAYESLAAESANAVDEAIAKHFESLIPSSAEGK
jgi:hypothetical protein